MRDLAEILLNDLREASAWLLEAGSTVSQASQSSRGQEKRHPLLSKIQVFGALVPACLRENSELVIQPGAAWVQSRTPRRARASRHPRDFLNIGHQLLPTRWERPDPLGEKEPRGHGWILHLWEALWAELEQARSRIGTQLARALKAVTLDQMADSFEIEIHERLRALEEQFETAERTLVRTRTLALRSSPTRITSSPRRPVPYPGGTAWMRLGQLSARILNPAAELPDTLHALIDGHTEIAELPFLYQRWCGLQAVEALSRLGWKARRDPVPALFLGGKIEFLPPGDAGFNGEHLTLWVEPRIPPTSSEETPHESGLSCSGSHALRPDYLFVSEDSHGAEAYILDPTFTTVAPEAEEKGKYRSRLSFRQPHMLAGVPTRKPPRRSWAAQPLHRSGNMLLDPEAKLGIVPMHPIQRDWTGLEHWLRDLLPQPQEGAARLKQD
ncbi:MAG: hypothetical protein CSA62_04625 [Planctomycetota bacterium]|nr:MAG: hypothetical protein CSA62_04625 [Planctomycetota bacterium]